MKRIKDFFTNYSLAVIILFFGVGLIIASFIVPPVGIIDNSVIMAVGEIFTFTAAICGIEQYGSSVKLKIESKRNEESKEID